MAAARPVGYRVEENSYILGKVKVSMVPRAEKIIDWYQRLSGNELFG